MEAIARNSTPIHVQFNGQLIAYNNAIRVTEAVDSIDDAVLETHSKELIKTLIAVGARKSGTKQHEYNSEVLKVLYEWQNKAIKEREIIDDNAYFAFAQFYNFSEYISNGSVILNKRPIKSAVKEASEILKTSIPISYVAFASVWLCGSAIFGTLLTIQSMRDTIGIATLTALFVMCFGLFATAVSAAVEWNKLIRKQNEEES